MARVQPWLKLIRKWMRCPFSASSTHVSPMNAWGFASVLLLLSATSVIHALDPIAVSRDGTHFTIGNGEETERFIVWGVNYDHDGEGRLLDEYWIDEWDTVVEDFREIKALGANCVRVHLQFGKFMDGPQEPNAPALGQLKRLVQLAEELELYLNVTGLACYHKQHVPAWYDALDESSRWQAQAQFWEAIARTCKHSPAIFCYDLMNEPVVPGKDPQTDWLLGELGGKFFVQRLALARQGRTPRQIAAAWVERMVQAVRQHDRQHLVTVGVIPWVFAFGGGQPLFYSPEVGQHLDFVSVHFYPEKGKVDDALAALKAYELGKPLVIEEMFPLKCSREELVEFVRASARHADGWFSFYWGSTAPELLAQEPPTIAAAITAAWLQEFRHLGAAVKSSRASAGGEAEPDSAAPKEAETTLHRTP